MSSENVHVIIGLLFIRSEDDWQIGRRIFHGFIQLRVCHLFFDKHLENQRHSGIDWRVWEIHWKKYVWNINNIKMHNKLNEIYLHLGSEISSSKAMYIALNEKIERLSHLIYMGSIKLTIPGLMIPSIFISLINFFVYDFGDDSFFLPFPVM